MLSFQEHIVGVLSCVVEDIPYDTLNCLKCCFCYRGIHTACVLDPTLPHICLHCVDPTAKKGLEFEETEQSSVRLIWTLPNVLFFFGISSNITWEGGEVSHSVSFSLCSCSFSLKQATKTLAEAKKEHRASTGRLAGRVLRKSMVSSYQSDDDADIFDEFDWYHYFLVSFLDL